MSELQAIVIERIIISMRTKSMVTFQVFVQVVSSVDNRVFHNNTFFSNDVYVFAIEDHDAEIIADFFSGVLGHFLYLNLAIIRAN